MKTKMNYWANLFYMPGVIEAETSRKYFDNLPNPEEIEFPEHAYAFEIYQREDIIKDGKTYEGDTEQIGKTYYHPDSKITNLEETKMHPDTDILIRNMEYNGWDKVIWTRWDSWPQPYDENKILILS